MAITSKTTMAALPVKPFPKIMRNTTNNQLVLFHKERHGVVINNEVFPHIGTYVFNWDMNIFIDHNYPVILQNE